MSPSAVHPRTELDQRIEVETPEQVVFSYSVAGVGSRAAAALIDYVIVVTALFALWALFWMVAAAVFDLRESGRAAARMSGSWALAVMVLVQFVVMWGYYVLFEALWDGQTPGKRRLGIRVVQDGGYSVSFAASAVRNLVRIVDMQPGILYAVGIVSAALTKSGKRLGDLVAGTFVVHERIVHVTAVAPAAGGSDVTPPPVSALLTNEEYELLERFVERRGSLDADRRRALAARLAERFRERAPDDGGQPVAFLLRLFERERAARARGVAARGATGAAREEHTIVAQNAARWGAFAKALAEAQAHGLQSMSDRAVSEFVAQYREVAADLARLRTASRGRDSNALFYVSRLVSAGHNLLYRQRPLSMRSVWRYVYVSVPREVRRSALPILGAAALLFLPMLVTYGVVVARPQAAEQLLPPTMIDRANESVARARSGGAGYVTVKDFERPIMASSIIANNVQVTYAAFAFGITAGILTALMLVLNGVSIGAAFGVYASKGILHLILEFVAAHGVLELSAISIAGGGGLLIASALLLPGPLTRREALVVKGRRAIKLITASTLLLVVAGTIEGLVSPRTDVPAPLKFGVSAATAVLLAFYLTRGRGTPEEPPEEESAYSEARALISR